MFRVLAGCYVLIVCDVVGRSPSLSARVLLTETVSHGLKTFFISVLDCLVKSLVKSITSDLTPVCFCADVSPKHPN